MNDPPDETTVRDKNPEVKINEDRSRDVHLKGVPVEVWQQARIAAIKSRLSFRDYLLTLLTTCAPIPVPKKGEPNEA
jgi:hypothetical protein